MKALTKSLFLLIFVLFLVVGCADEIIEPEVTATPRPTPRPTPAPEIEPPDFEIIECRHFWRIPDCHTPRYCLDCGEISAGPTPHEPTEANFQEPPVCTLCGDVVGDVLEPNFTVLGLQINATSGRSYDFHTVTNLDPSITTVGTASLLFVDILESLEDLPTKPGYEFIRATIMLIFDDEEANQYGYGYIIGHVDYYTINLNEQSVAHLQLPESDIPGFRTSNRTINLNGEEREYFIRYEEISTAWVDGAAHVIREYTFLVPIGYDGIVVYLSSAALWTDHSRIISDNIDENTLFFRLVAQTG